MNRAYYAESIHEFLKREPDAIIGALEGRSLGIDKTQGTAWREQVAILKPALMKLSEGHAGRVYFEYAIPRLGRRIDVVVVLGPVVFVLEFKVGEKVFSAHAVDQVWDYALDLKNFHETSHDVLIVPVLVATAAPETPADQRTAIAADRLARPLLCNAEGLGSTMGGALSATLSGAVAIDAAAWEAGRYCPTPTIIEAATALYGGHSVDEIIRKDASAKNLSATSKAVADVIAAARAGHHKAICFVTGVPGAGKTLVGLDIATQHMRKEDELYSVFLSGNDPLVSVLREALTRDTVRQAKDRGKKLRKGEAMSRVKAFVQNVRHFRDECLVDEGRSPIEHVALFDEAQRAWTHRQTANFMQRKRNRPNFAQSEPEFLISCLDRHRDWATVVCLVGGGQEINTGEAGISEWVKAVVEKYPDWHVHVSSRLTDSEYTAGAALERLGALPHVTYNDDLHLSVSMRSYRAERLSRLVKQVLDRDRAGARQTLSEIGGRYPLVLTRSLPKAKQWLREHARGTERYGIVVSSEAQRLKPHAIDVRVDVDPVQWFLKGKDDVRSSYYLEDVATQFQVQGLELDWTCVTWDGDLRFSESGWEHWSFAGTKWQKIRIAENQRYLENAYRVLLTRARQGMVICIPEGDDSDPTRSPSFYDATFDYLKDVGMTVV